MSKTVIVAALEREVSGFVRHFTRVAHTYDGRTYTFFEHADLIVVCGGIGAEAARRAAEAAFAIYRPTHLHSVGFAGALTNQFRVGDILTPAVVIDARNGSRIQIPGGQGTLITFMDVATSAQKNNLAQAYSAQAVDMEAGTIAAAAHAHSLTFSAIKVISDGLDFEMPQTARFIDAQGRFKTSAFALHVSLRPWLWSRTAQLARNSNHAARNLTEHLKKLFSSTSINITSEIVETKTS
jgi:adenosylhomocysteine nucleosidase